MASKKVSVRHHYDEESDILYVYFGEKEPTYVENIDDLLLLEIGWFSGLPKGFRILGPKYHNISSVKLTMVIRQIQEQVRRLMESRRKAIKEQEPIFTNFCGALPNILESVRL